MSFEKPASLRDGEISLAPLSSHHLEGMESLGLDEAVLAHTYVTAPFDADKAMTWLARYIQGWRDGSCAGFAIERSGSGDFLGFCALVRMDADAGEAEVGYITAPQARGQGVGVRALKLISRWALEVLEMKRLELRISTDNEASMKVAERAGYQHEGIMRSLHFKQGIRKDMGIYSLVTA